MRKLTKTLAVMSLLAPASAYSLGIGSIKVHSGLNQNLNAEIALIRSTNEDVSDIKVSLAPPAKFDEAGIPWSAFLSKIKLEPVVKANGSTVIKVSSNEVLKESFLDFLLEVSWPKGSLFREFTVLLEPPVYQKVSTSRVQAYQSFEEAPRQQPVNKQPKRHVEAPRPRRHVVHIDRRHNVTRKHDTLWKVAERVRREGEPTVEQMMIAIYEANPQAFYRDNINALLPNKTLNIPKKEDVLSLSQDQALAEFNEQMHAWKNNGPVAARKEAAPAEEPVADKQLTLVAPTDAPVADDAATSLAHEAAPATDKAIDEKPKAGDANGQGGEAKEGVNVVAPGQDVKTDKVAELENQLATIQKNLAEKEQQLKSLQNGGKPLPTESANPPTNEVEITTPVIKAPELPKLPSIKPEIKPQIQSPLVEPPVTDTTPLWLAGIGGGLLALIGWLWWRKRKFDEQFDGESMFAPSSMIKTSSPATPKPASKSATNTPNAVAAGGALEDNSFLNEFTASDFEVFDTSHVEIDPVSETDVYLAYGRYQQAEELMRQAIKDQPDNDEYKLKLLEIFCANERKKDFVNYAAELAEAGKKDQPEFWVKVVEMGGEVWADLTLTSGGEMFIPENDAAVENIYTHLAPAEHEHAELTDHDSHDLTANDSELAKFDVATFDSAFEESLLGSDSELFVPHDTVEGTPDFDLVSEFDGDGEDHELQNNESIDFDLGSLVVSTDNNAAPAVKVQEQETPRFSLDKTGLSLEDVQEIEISDLAAGRNDVEAPDAFSLDSLISPDDKSHQELVLKTDGSPSLTLDANPKDYDGGEEFDFDFDFDLADTPATATSNAHYFDETDSGFDFMDLDELETKLDLAKAYIDMGDADAAKEIIAEVLDKGNAEQVKTARNLFDSLV